jgi:hypothetical protein
VLAGKVRRSGNHAYKLSDFKKVYVRVVDPTAVVPKA